MLEGTVRGMEPHLCRQPSNRCGSSCSPGQGQVPLPLGGSMSCRSHEPTLPSCDHSRASNLSPLPVHQRGTGLLSKINTSSRHEKDHLFIELCKSQKLLVEFSRSLSTQGNSCSSLGTARPQVCPITYKRDSAPPSTLPLP